MKVSLQIISLIINFIYGFSLFYLSYLNYLFIKKEPLIVKILITLVFMLDYTIIYLIIFYKLTSGMMHIYYLLLFILGYFIGYKVKDKNIIKKIKLSKRVVKKKKES